MKDFGSLGAFALHLMALEAAQAVALHHGLAGVAKAVETTAKGEFGEYQEAAGPFPAWPDLADATQADRERHGFAADEPLLRTGALRASVSHAVDGLEAVVGSDSDVMVWQEMGTRAIPPRPVLGPAVIRNEEAIHRLLGQAAVRGLLGGADMPTGLGYDADV